MIVAYGQFDGVHRGHQAVLSHHPDVVYVQPISAIGVLTTNNQREELIKQYAGLQCKVVVSQHPLQHAISATLVVGEDMVVEPFHTPIERVPLVLHTGQPITSDRIRGALLEGYVEDAQAMLGHPYTLDGEVVYGKQLGRTVGMPTVNLKVDPLQLIPKHGVYGSITIVDGQRYLGVTSIGPRPTVDDLPTVTIETFLLHFNRELYGQFISLELKTYIRPITKFDSLEAVRKQVDEDVRYVVEKRLH